MFTDPVKNLKALGLGEDNIIADLGAGTGYYALPAGTLVPRGKVYAIEVDKSFLDTIVHKVKEAYATNIEIIWGNIEKIGGTKLGDSTVDAAIVSNVFFQLEDKHTFIQEVRRILKPGGRILFVDWSPGSVMGKSIPVPKEKTEEMFRAEGLQFERDIDTGMHHYGIIFIKEARP